MKTSPLAAAPALALGILFTATCCSQAPEQTVIDNAAPVALSEDGTATVYFVETSGGS